MVSESQVAGYIRGLNAGAARERNGSSKALRLASREAPELVYPHFDRVAALLAGDNTILRWNAAFTLGNLAVADRAGRLDHMIGRFCKPIAGPEMIGAANVIHAAAEIAVAKPHLASRIAREILKVEHGEYATAECRDVAIGHAIRAFDRMWPLTERTQSVLAFVQRQLDNPRPATRRKAERFLRRVTANRNTTEYL